jgi:hypothetical protein
MKESKTFNHDVLMDAIVGLERLKNRTYEEFRAKECGVKSKSYFMVRMSRQRIDLIFICMYLFANEETTLKTKNLKIVLENADPNLLNKEDLSKANKALKADIIRLKTIPWRTVSEEIGYVNDSGVLARSMRSRTWSPVDFIYTVMKLQKIKTVTGTFGTVTITFTILK